MKTDIANLDFSIISKSLQGLTLWQPIAIFGTAYLIGLTLFGLLSSTHSIFAGLDGALLLMILVGAGYLGAGHFLSAVAQDRALPSLVQSLSFGLFTLPRFIGLIIIEYLLVIAVIIVEIILVEICRIPVLGGLLSLLIFPAIFLANVALVMMFFVMFNLTGPALWFGETVAGAFRHVVAVARRRPGPVIFLLLSLAALAVLIGLLVFGVAAYVLALMSGYVGLLGPQLYGVVTEFLQSLVNPFASAGMESLADSSLGYMFHVTFNDHLYPISALLTVACFLVLVVAIPNNVLMLGLAYLYDLNTKIVDPEEGSAFVDGVMSGMSKMAERTRQAAEQARQAAREASQRAAAARPENPVPPTEPASPSSAVATHPTFCRGCGAALSANDKFCGECGRPV
ncbi:MAG: zinc ribbon domain-containing protein [Acidithiobacillus sp.]|nr:zinc ribbon domain-containing protein [Acidithiobacillus sp.]